MVPLEDCLAAAEECNAPMVSICGGEPLIYPQIEALVDGLLEQGRIIYICTNAMFMRKKMREWMASEYPKRAAVHRRRRSRALVGRRFDHARRTPTAIRQGRRTPTKPTIGPSKWMYWNVHLDGLEWTHDLIVEREGVFKECILAIKMAKMLGYQVATNTTIYKETDMEEIEQMFDFLSDLGVDGHTISPGYEYDAAKKDMIKRLNLQPENFFLTRKMTIEKFKKIEEWMKNYTIFGTPIYFEFLAGKRDLTCSAWAIPTRNIARLERPVLPDDRRALSQLPGNAGEGGVGQIRRRERRREDSRCENCMVHCGYEPTASLGLNAQKRRYMEDGAFNFGAKPKPTGKGNEIAAYNGVTSGNGHLTGKKAAARRAGCR